MMGSDFIKRSEAAKKSWEKLTPYQRKLRGFVISMTAYHRNHCIGTGSCICEAERQKRLPSLVALRSGNTPPS
jgi:hypothetical protein